MQNKHRKDWVVVGAVAALASLCWAGPVVHPYLYLKIYQHTPEALADHPEGYVPVNPKKPLPHAASASSYVRVIGALPLFTFEKLIGVMRQRHLTGLDLSAQPTLHDSTLTQLSHLSALRFLSLDGTAATSAILPVISQLKNLEVLLLNKNTTDQSLEHLASLPHLRELGLSDSPITDSGIGIVSHLSNLEALDLSGTAVTAQGLAALKGLPLKRLSLGTGVDDQGLAALGARPNLEQLDLSMTRVSDDGLAQLTLFPALNTLFLGPSITDQGMNFVAKQSTIRRLDLTGARMSNAALDLLTTLPHLEELALSQIPITDEGLTILARCSELRDLEISDTEITPLALSTLASFPKLEVVSFSWRGILTKHALASLGAAPKLRLVIINGAPLSRAILKELQSEWRAPTNIPSAALTPSQKLANIRKSSSTYINFNEPQTGALPERPYTTTSPAPMKASVVTPPTIELARLPLPKPLLDPAWSALPKETSSDLPAVAPSESPVTAQPPVLKPGAAALREKHGIVQSNRGMRRISVVQAELDNSIADESDLASITFKGNEGAQ